MTTMRRTRSFAALAAAATLALTACGGGDGSSGEGSSSESSSQSSSESASESETQESESESDASVEDGTVTAQKSGVTFEVPEGWKSIDPNELLKSSANPPKALEDMAKAQGTSVDQLLQGLAQSVDVMVIGETKNGFADNINVVSSPQMPTESDLKSQLEQTGATVEGTEEVKTAPGTALSTTYVLPVGSKKVQGRMLAVPTDKGAAMITVSTGEAKAGETVAKAIIDSVDKA